MKRGPMAERFWSKVDKNGPVPEHRPELGPCHLWTAGLDADGYGRFGLNGRNRKAHVVSYEIQVGPIPSGLEPDHLCRVRRCVNDAHLEPVTRAENMRRGDGPALLRARQLAKTHCPQGHPYIGENLIVRHGQRSCRICKCASDHRRYAKRNFT